jgi:hypothetical protein
MQRQPLNYLKQKEYVDSLVDPFLPELYEQCLPIMTKLMEKFWLEWTDNPVAQYRAFSNSKFADHLYKRHFYRAFVNGWKTGYFSLGQVINFESLLENDLLEVGDSLFEEATAYYSTDTAAKLLYLIEIVKDIGIDSGKKTPMN